MSQPSTSYTFGFAAGICLVCSLFVSGAAVALADLQEQNKILDKQKKVLAVAQIIEEGASPSAAEVQDLFASKIDVKVVDMKTGKEVEAPFEVSTYDQKKASKDPAMSFEVEPNDAKVGRIPNHTLVYCVKEADGCGQYILPIEGKGLWSTLRGFLSLDKDLGTIRGITFYEHGETPGLGGEIDNPGWKASWPGRKLYSEEGKLAIKVIKGKAGPVESAPHSVDGISGATLTCKGVNHLVRYWMGEKGFGPYLANLKQGSAK